MWINQVERRNATNHKINCLCVLASEFPLNSSERNYLINRVGELKIKLNDSTFNL